MGRRSVILPGPTGGSSGSASLTDAQMAALLQRGDETGYLWQAAEIDICSQNSAALTSGVLYTWLVHWPFTGKANPTFDAYVQTAGATVVAGQNFMGLYLLGTSQAPIASVGIDSWITGTGQKSASLTVAAGSLPSGGLGSYMLAAILLNATTCPIFKMVANGVAAGLMNIQNVSNRPTRWGTSGTGQTALPTTLNTTTLTSAGGSTPLWAGIR